MREKLLFFLVISGVFANSGGPSQGYAHNAPNMNNCTQCHSGSTNAGNGMVSFVNLPEYYVPGETYSIGVEVTGTNQRGYGFQAIAQSGNSVAGEISLNSNSSSAEMNGNYVQHSTRTTSGSWVFDWVAPSSDIGEVTFSASGLATGGNNGTGGDDVYTVSSSIISQTPTDFTGLFFSEYGEPDGGNHKYLEIYNGTGGVVSLDDVVILGNYNGNPWSEAFTFQSGASIAVGDVYIVANSEADDAILALADETHAFGDPWYITSFNGDDVRALAEINGTDTTIIDIIGTLEGGDPGSGWEVAGVENATQNHVLVRKSSVTAGNAGNWANSSGTTADNSEWHVLEHNNWSYLGSHPHEMSAADPSIVISSPEDGSTLLSGDVNVEFLVTDFIVGTGEDTDGHIHYVLDGGDPVMHYSTDPISLTGLAEGDHTFAIRLVDNNHVDLNPFVGDDISFTVSEGALVTSIYDIQYVSDPDADDASPFNGQEVTIQGIVTAEFWGSDQYRYMFVQDAEGPWNGIVCFEYDGWDNFDWVDVSGSPHTGPAEGDEVTLTGTIEEYYNLTELTSVSSGVVHGASDEMIAPSLIPVIDMGEAYEGCLVAFGNVTVSNSDLGYGEWEFSNADGSARVDDKWDYYYFPHEGHEIAYIEGVVDYSFSNYKLQPRLARDVVEQGTTRIQRVQQVLYSDLMKAGEDAASDTSYMLNETVTLEGIVTMPTGLSYAGSGVKFIFADVNGGPWSAILSYDPDSSAFPTLYEGDLIQATGYVYEYSTGPANMTELFITEPINIIDFEQPLPIVDTVNTGELRWPTEAEQWGNVMIRVEDAMVVGNDFQYEVFAADDGSGSVLVDDDSDSIATYFDMVGPPPVGSLLQSMEGWLYHHYGSYEDSSAYKLCPLYIDDLEFGAGPPSISMLSRDPCAPTSNDGEVEVSCVIMDNSTIQEALVHYSIDGGDYQIVNMVSDGDSTYTGVISVSNGNTVYYYITATDDGVDQAEPKTSVYPYDINYDQLGFHVTDDLTVKTIQETPWPSGNTLYEGCTVTLTGVVTADTAQYESSYSSYALQDDEGQWNGIIFDLSVDASEPIIMTRGDEVTVTGLVTDNDPDWTFKFGGNTRLINALVEVGSSQGEPAPSVVSCEDIHQTADEVESYEGVLVKLNNATISAVNDFDWAITDETGFEALIDDDMANMEADNMMSMLSEGDVLDQVMGIFNYSFGTYKVQIRDESDLGTTMGFEDEINTNPYEYALHENFPNPFNPETQIRFSIGGEESVKLIIYDMMGRQVQTLIDGDSFSSGYHVVNWNGLDSKGQKVPSGVYIYRIKAGTFIADKKMLLVK